MAGWLSSEIEIEGRQKTEAGPYLAEVVKNNPRLARTIAGSLANIETGRENFTFPYSSDENIDRILDDLIFRLSNEELLVYLADEIRQPRDKELDGDTTGLYKEGTERQVPFGGGVHTVADPDTAFVEYQNEGQVYDIETLARVTMHEAFLHGGGQVHQKVPTGAWIWGVDEKDLARKGVTDDHEYEHTTSQHSYDMEELDMLDALLYSADPSGKYSALYGLMHALYGRPVKEREYYSDENDWWDEIDDQVIDYINSGDY